MITWSQVVEIAADVADLSSATQTAILALVEARMSASAWGDLYDHGCKLLAAHYAIMSKNGANGVAGQVIAESVGSISRQYSSNSPMGTDPTYDKTPYGREFRVLMRLLPSRLGFVC